MIRQYERYKQQNELQMNVSSCFLSVVCFAVYVFRIAVFCCSYCRSLLFVLSFLNVIDSSFCRLYRSYCRSLLFIVVSDSDCFDNHPLKLVYRSTPVVADKLLAMVYSAIKIVERFRNGCQIATKQLRNDCQKKIPYRDTLLKKLWSNYVPIQHDESCE